MAKFHKIWSKIKDKPYRSDIRMAELDLLLVNVGFQLRSQNGSHRCYLFPENGIVLTIPCRNDTDCLKPAYIKMVYEKIEELEIQI